jgi:hypothetical protein
VEALASPEGAKAFDVLRTPAEQLFRSRFQHDPKLFGCSPDGSMVRRVWVWKPFHRDGGGRHAPKIECEGLGLAHFRGDRSVESVRAEESRTGPWLAGRIGKKDRIGRAAVGTQGHVIQVARPRAGWVLTLREVAPNEVAGVPGVFGQSFLAKSSNEASRSQRDW